MPTLKQRMDQLEQLVQEMRDPIVLAATKDDHSLAQRLLELEKQYAELNSGLAVLSQSHGDLNQMQDDQGAAIEQLKDRVDRWAIVSAPSQPGEPNA